MSQPTSILRLLRHPAESRESIESVALMVGAAAFVVSAVIAIFAFRDGAAPISGPDSLGQFVAVVSAIVTVLVVVWARMLVRARPKADPALPRLSWFDVAAIALAYGLIALLGWIGIASVLSLSFIGAEVFAYWAIILAGVATAVTAYVAFLSAVRLTPMLLSVILALFLVVGTLTSMLSASDPQWWTHNLSSLGITNDLSSRAFNITLIVGGVLVTTLANYATATLPSGTVDEQRHRRLVRLALTLIGILLACVGIFPMDVSLALHNLSATGMAIVFVTLVLSLRVLIPATPHVFVLLGYVFVAVIVVLGVFFAIGYYSLTAVELVVAVLVFSWLIVFMRNQGIGAEPLPIREEAESAWMSNS